MSRDLGVVDGTYVLDMVIPRPSASEYPCPWTRYSTYRVERVREEEGWLKEVISFEHRNIAKTTSFAVV